MFCLLVPPKEWDYQWLKGLVNHGANVVISSRKLDQCQKAADAINESVGQEKAFAFACNASSKEELNALVDFSIVKTWINYNFSM